MTADRIRDGDYSNNNRRKRRNVKILRREGRFPSLNNKALFTLAACSAALRLGFEHCSDTPDASMFTFTWLVHLAPTAQI